MRKCNKCNEEKPDSEFYKNKRNATGYLYSCKDCIKEYNKSRKKENLDNLLKLYYNITLKEYNKILKEQNCRCKICNIHNEDVYDRLHVDHCHTTGKVRGLLCFQCNSALGKFKDDVQLLQNAIEYLKNKS